MANHADAVRKSIQEMIWVESVLPHLHMVNTIHTSHSGRYKTPCHLNDNDKDEH